MAPRIRMNMWICNMTVNKLFCVLLWKFKWWQLMYSIWYNNNECHQHQRSIRYIYILVFDRITTSPLLKHFVCAYLLWRYMYGWLHHVYIFCSIVLWAGLGWAMLCRQFQWLNSTKYVSVSTMFIERILAHPIRIEHESYCLWEKDCGTWQLNGNTEKMSVDCCEKLLNICQLSVRMKNNPKVFSHSAICPRCLYYTGEVCPEAK